MFKSAIHILYPDILVFEYVLKSKLLLFALVSFLPYSEINIKQVLPLGPYKPTIQRLTDKNHIIYGVKPSLIHTHFEVISNI